MTEAFLDALETASLSSTSATSPDGVPLRSPLEEDFDANWPDPLQYAPPPGKEPVPRPANYLAPNPARSEMFSRFTFIFSDQKQFDSLQPVLTSGSGKALKFDMKLGETTLQEFVQYVRSVADKKGLGELGDTTQSKGVVVVRFRGEGDTEQWALDFIKEMDRALDQRSIEQNEFLDAILTVDATSLRKPLQEEDVEGITAPPSTAGMFHKG